MRVIGVPKTIDNDLDRTSATFGFDTAVQIATELIDRVFTTATSHSRVFVVEVMGRYAGWIALNAGLAAGAHAILIPEIPYSLESGRGHHPGRAARGADFAVVVVAEGAMPPRRCPLDHRHLDRPGRATGRCRRPDRPAN